MARLYKLFRMVHRLLVVVVTALVLTMSLTGMALKYTTTTLKLFPALDIAQLRYVHNQLTPYISIVLIIMALSGLGMYLLPPMIRRRVRKQSVS